PPGPGGRAARRGRPRPRRPRAGGAARRPRRRRRSRRRPVAGRGPPEGVGRAEEQLQPHPHAVDLGDGQGDVADQDDALAEDPVEDLDQRDVLAEVAAVAGPAGGEPPGGAHRAGSPSSTGGSETKWWGGQGPVTSTVTPAAAWRSPSAAARARNPASPASASR